MSPTLQDSRKRMRKKEGKLPAQEARMLHHVITRFPEHAQTIEALNQTNSGFEELVHRYGHVVERLLHLGSTTTESLPEVEGLRKRRVALEEELLLAINSNRI